MDDHSTFSLVCIGLGLQIMSMGIGKAKRDQPIPLTGPAEESRQHLEFSMAKSKSFFGREDLVRAVMDTIVTAVDPQTELTTGIING